MNPTHIHLLITHLPIFGSILGAVVLTYGLFARSRSTQMASYLLFIISTIGAVIAYLTGEEAEETVEHLPGIAEAAIERHEDFALFALVALCILGAASLVAIYFSTRKKESGNTWGTIVLVLSLISFALSARTGFLGGKIRHTEIQSDSQPATPYSGEEEHNGEQENHE